MYCFETRIRYSETKQGETLTPGGIIRYFQDCSIFHTRDSGEGITLQETSNRAWMLSSWHIVIHQYPRLGDRLKVKTWPSGIKGIYGYRNFVLEDEHEMPVVEADSTWFLLDLETGMPRRVTDKDLEPYGADGPRIAMPPVSKKIVVPEHGEVLPPVPVTLRQIDSNHHVNNVEYVEMALAASGGEPRITQLRVDYKKAAVFGDLIYPRVTSADDSVTVVLANEQQEIFAAVWFQKE